MALKPVCRLGDTSSHGGAMVSASGTVRTDGIQACRDQDTLACPIHGDNPVTGTGITTIDGGRKRIRIGDVAGCGAVMTTGSLSTVCG
jgi:uncharacterized Zn-binding protein involved in type VI secretion